MKLNEFEESVIHDFVMGSTDSIPSRYDDILSKVELGVQIDQAIEFGSAGVAGVDGLDSPAFSLRPAGTALLIFTQDAELARSVLVAFKERLIRTLTVRIERSWRCYVHCGDRIIEKTCEEDKASTEACCDGLRSEC